MCLVPQHPSLTGPHPVAAANNIDNVIWRQVLSPCRILAGETASSRDPDECKTQREAPDDRQVHLWCDGPPVQDANRQRYQLQGARFLSFLCVHRHLVCATRGAGRSGVGAAPGGRLAGGCGGFWAVHHLRRPTSFLCFHWCRTPRAAGLACRRVAKPLSCCWLHAVRAPQIKLAQVQMSGLYRCPVRAVSTLSGDCCAHVAGTARSY